MSEPSLADEPRQVRITTDGTTGRIEVDGTNISSMLHGYSLEHRVGQLPLLVLHAHPHREGVAFEGVAHVAVGTEHDPGEAIAAFLANIDPAALEQAALNRDDLDGTKSELTKAMLAQLADWAQGKR